MCECVKLRWTHEPPRVEGLYLYRTTLESGRWGDPMVAWQQSIRDWGRHPSLQWCGPLVIGEPVEEGKP